MPLAAHAHASSRLGFNRAARWSTTTSSSSRATRGEVGTSRAGRARRAGRATTTRAAVAGDETDAEARMREAMQMDFDANIPVEASTMRQTFPLAAVIGQEKIKRARCCWGGWTRR